MNFSVKHQSHAYFHPRFFSLNVMQLKTMKLVLMSILLHIAVIWAMLSIHIPVRLEDTPPLRVLSYLVVAPAMNAPVISEPVNTEAMQISHETVAKKADIKLNQSLPEINTSSEVLVEKISETNGPELALKTDDLSHKNAIKPSGDNESFPLHSLTGARKFIHQLHNEEVSSMAQDAFTSLAQPKPINSASSGSIQGSNINPYRESFAPRGSNIQVVSGLTSANETNILLNDTCFTVTETKLEDKVWRGRSVFKGSSVCAKQDTFNGQLQISLDKYLKK